MANLIRRGRTWFARLHIPEDRQADVGRAMGAKGGIKREIVRTLQTQDHREASRRRDAALAAMRAEIDAALTRAKLRPLTDWTADWLPKALELRQQLQDHGRDVIGHELVQDDRTGEEVVVPMTADTVLQEEAERLADVVRRRQGPVVAHQFLSVANAVGNSVAQVARDWLAGEKDRIKGTTFALHKATLRNFEAFFAAHYGTPTLETVAIGDVTRETAARFITERAKEVAAPTIKREHSTFMGLWRFAIRKGRAKENPWSDQTAGLSHHAAGSKERGYTAPELVKLLRAGRSELAPAGGGYAATHWDLIRLALLTGARLEELVSLKLRDVIADGTAIAVASSLHGEGRKGKTDSAPRIIPLHAFARRVIRDRLASLPNADPEASLWPEIPAQGPDQKRSKKIASLFPVIRRRILGESDEVDFHYFRRTFMTAAETALHSGGRLNSEMVGLLVGHKRGNLAFDIYSDWARIGRRMTSGLLLRLAKLQDAVDDIVELGFPPEVVAALAETADNRPPVVRTAPKFIRKSPKALTAA
jgi:integrase